MSLCLNCNTKTSNPKFCSRACSSSYNNKKAPKRKPEGSCYLCGTPVKASRKYCKSCFSSLSEPELTLKVNSNQGSNPYVRGHARTVYRNSGRPYFCSICKYDKHVDICHIKDIRSYPDLTPYSVINHESNLIALCKNHHWEFDHDML